MKQPAWAHARAGCFLGVDLITLGLFKGTSQSRVPKGRLNLAQDAVLGSDSRDEKSRRDDWKLPDNFFSRPCGTFPWRLPTQDCVLG